MERANEVIVKLAVEKKVENGKSLRHDTTVVETDIAYPTDAKLLNDSVRVINRLLQDLRGAAPELEFDYHDHTRRAKKRAYQIVMGKGRNIEQRRRNLYEDLLAVQQTVRTYAAKAVEASMGAPAVAGRLEVMAILAMLAEILLLAEQVYDQAYRRVILDEQVPADEKLVSILRLLRRRRTHTDIICRGKKDSPTEFGHKVDFATGRSGIVIRYEVLNGNPSDHEILERALDDHIQTFGKPPERLTADRRYHSAENERMATQDKGVKQVAQ